MKKAPSLRKSNLSDNNIENYVRDLIARQSKERTVAHYRRVLRSLLEFCKDKCNKEDLRTCSKGDVISFKFHLAKKFAPVTVNFYLAVIREFFRYLYKKGICENVTIGIENAFEARPIPKVLPSPTKPRLLDADIEDFLDDLKSRGSKEYTIVHYRRILNSLFEFCKKEYGKDSLRAWSRADVINYKWHIATTCAPKTVNLYLGAILQLFRYLEKKGICENITKGVEFVWGEKVIPSFVGDKELNQLFELTDNSPGTFLTKSPCSEMLNLRDLAIFEILIGTGITSSELCEIRRCNIDIKDGYLLVPNENGSSRILPFPRQTFDTVRRYSEYREKVFQHSPYFFLNRIGAQLHRVCAYRVCSKFLNQTESKKKGARTLRNTYINVLSQRGANIGDIKYLTGHSSLQHLVKYSDLSVNVQRFLVKNF